MWEELGIAVALLLVMEGLLPFMSPALFRKAVSVMTSMDDRSTRLSGLVSMVVGVVLLYLIH